ncbi:prolyl-tRNA synthetase [Xylariaceae sp. FL0662B]|nr:prolyl-tRNA synthetase [Xylariaceae sp. FL0662B]
MSFLYTFRRGTISTPHCMRIAGVRPSGKIAVSSQFSSTLHPQDRFTRLSRVWVPTGGMTRSVNEDGHAKLMRAGYLRKSSAGIYHMLPLGQRVQRKLERLIDKYMAQLGASKISLSSISSQALWQQTNRLEGYGPELFRFTDRKEVPYLLAPTHEEEITTLVAKTVNSYKSLPLRLYQIGRKYRDEIRPRHGLLRSREFVMKDLYTFDYSTETALSTYEQVRAAYSRLFDELKLPYLVAEASSGDIGGDLSHEYHLPTPIGEDNVIRCNTCDYVSNEELATARIPSTWNNDANVTSRDHPPARVWRGVSKDRRTFVNVWYPDSFSDADINTYAIKSVLPGLDSSLGDSMRFWFSAPDLVGSTTSEPSLQLMNIVDYRLKPSFADRLKDGSSQLPLLPQDCRFGLDNISCSYVTHSPDGSLLNVIRILGGDDCPRCPSGKLEVNKTIELGHTFHLGTRYSDPLAAKITVPASLVVEDRTADINVDSTMTVPMQMGCHGIGVSRILGAVADHLVDKKGLNWPRAIAPFEVVIIPRHTLKQEGYALAEDLINSKDGRFDVALDDRPNDFQWKLQDADLIGFPVVVILGRKYSTEKLYEVQCRRLSSFSHVSRDDLLAHIHGLLSQL